MIRRVIVILIPYAYYDRPVSIITSKAAYANLPVVSRHLDHLFCFGLSL